MFFPPELAAQSELEEATENLGLGSQTALMRSLYFQNLSRPSWGESGDELAELVLEHARKIIAHPARPRISRLETFDRLPFADLALEETLDDNPGLRLEEPILVEETIEKPFSCVAMLDTSASMSGEKHLLASIAVAVMLLEVASHDASVIVFASEAKTVKELKTQETNHTTLINFLKVQPRGFTNITRGLEEGLKQLERRREGRRRMGLIATDGRSTEGGDPVEMARKYDSLVVLHLHGPGSHLESSQDIAAAGNGICLEVDSFEELPYRMYDAMKILVRV